VPLVDLIHKTRHLGCSDPRDRLFAVAGLSKEFKITHGSISQIGSYSMTKDRFFSELTTYIIEKKLDLIILDFVDHVKFHDTIKASESAFMGSGLRSRICRPGEAGISSTAR
jgi:hypothetical protein